MVDEWLRQSPRLNLAVITGRCSGIAVLDIDGPEGLQSLRESGWVAPRTLTQRTPRGWHCVYRMDPVGPVIKTATGVRPHLDIKGDGGCFTAAPSRRPAGIYRWHFLEPIAPAPEWMVTASRPRPAAAVPERQSGPAGWVQDALDHGVAESARNSTATRLAGYFRARGVDVGVMTSILRGFAARCSPPLSDAEIETVVRSISRYPEGRGDGGVLFL